MRLPLPVALPPGLLTTLTCVSSSPLRKAGISSWKGREDSDQNTRHQCNNSWYTHCTHTSLHLSTWQSFRAHLPSSGQNGHGRFRLTCGEGRQKEVVTVPSVWWAHLEVSEVGVIGEERGEGVHLLLIECVHRLHITAALIHTSSQLVCVCVRVCAYCEYISMYVHCTTESSAHLTEALVQPAQRVTHQSSLCEWVWLTVHEPRDRRGAQHEGDEDSYMRRDR